MYKYEQKQNFEEYIKNSIEYGIMSDFYFIE